MRRVRWFLLLQDAAGGGPAAGHAGGAADEGETAGADAEQRGQHSRVR